MKVELMDLERASKAARAIIEETGYVCPECGGRLKLRAQAFCPCTGDSNGRVTSFSLGEPILSLMCEKCETEHPIPTWFKKELKKRLADSAGQHRIRPRKQIGDARRRSRSG